MLIGPGLGALAAACQLGLMAGPLPGHIGRDLGLAPAGLALVVVAQLVAVAAGFAAGYLLGRRVPATVVSSGLVFMLLGAVVTTLSASAAVLAVAALLAGLGQGAALGAAAALTGTVSERRAPVRLTLGLAVFAALVVGPLLGWLAARSLSWRLAYLTTVPPTLVALLAVVVIAVVAAARGTRITR
ncbi:MFS transporter [Catellatospora coxensis]